jgi:benzodiazapine receptor
VKNVATLAVFLILVASAAAFGGIFQPGPWYAGLAKPDWTPPNSWFGPVWSLLYVCIAVAGWLVWRATGPGRRTALALWAAQLTLNALWSWLFFGLHLKGLALLDILLLWSIAAAFAWRARGLSKLASGLFAPYLAWVGFASALNAALWWMNPGA